MNAVPVWKQVHDEIERRFACTHGEDEVRVKIASNGALQYRLQCLRCGAIVRSVKKAEVTTFAVPEFDDDLSRKWWVARSETSRQLTAHYQQAESRNWFQDYDQYLRSPEWRRKRDQVLARDDHLCQASIAGHCTRRATQVHHLTYKHLGNEPLFDLQAVCEDCHEAITRMDRERRGAA